MEWLDRKIIPVFAVCFLVYIGSSVTTSSEDQPNCGYQVC